MPQKHGEWLDIRLTAMQLEQLQREGLDAFLCGYLRTAPSFVHKLKSRQGVQLKDDRLRLRLFPETAGAVTPEWMDLDMLYEDDYCLVVHKPAGLPVHPTVPGQTGTLAGGVAAHFQCTGQAAAVRHIHRLDVWTSGPVLYAKNEFAQLRLDEAMRHKTIERVYVAIVQGSPASQRGTWDFPIGRDRHHKQRRRVSATGDRAVTHYEVIERYEEAALLRLRLETGRTHQIRVHASHAGHPLVGDELYGGSSRFMARQALHGEELRFPHPMSDETVQVKAPWPDDFKQALKRLQNYKI